MSAVNSKQVKDTARNKTLDQILLDLLFTFATKSITFPDGTILKWGTTGAFGTIGANSSATETVTFPVAFPASCDYFHAVLTPNTTADFYGMTSIVSRTASQAQFTARNGATSQSIASGVWFAIGK